MTKEQRIAEIKEFVENLRANICGIIGHVSALGNEKFALAAHIKLAEILNNVDSLNVCEGYIEENKKKGESDETD